MGWGHLAHVCSQNADKDYEIKLKEEDNYEDLCRQSTL